MLSLIVKAQCLKDAAVAKARKLITDESGATAIEYGLIAALVAVVIIGALTLVGNGLRDKFTTVANSLGAS